MLKVFTMLVLALDFAPGYKRLAGGAMLALSATAVAFNNFVAPQIGFPAVPAEVVDVLRVSGEGVLGYGVVAAAAR